MTRHFVGAFRLLGNQNRPQSVQLKCTIGAIIRLGPCPGKSWGIRGTLTCNHQCVSRIQQIQYQGTVGCDTMKVDGNAEYYCTNYSSTHSITG